ncbi:protein CREG1-like [Ipomoea triloba]|uniref:protein CREG1-like n=1 Tax=Ipomoea triloba TaxID=35885 RepID=UPI00125D86E0|nr:protein CREG1-like [Ipomoea triloba]
MRSAVAVFPFLFFLLSGFVNGRVLPESTPRPSPDAAAAFARWLVSQNSWGVLSTLAADSGGAPFGNVVSFSDGLPDKGLGVPYFYLTTLDPTARYGLKDPRVSLTLSEYSLGTCGNNDPESPLCSKITLTGKFKLVDGKSKNLVSSWPKDHNFEVYTMEIEDIYLINFFGGPKPLTVDQYLKWKSS